TWIGSAFVRPRQYNPINVSVVRMRLPRSLPSRRLGSDPRYVQNDGEVGQSFATIAASRYLVGRRGLAGGSEHHNVQTDCRQHGSSSGASWHHRESGTATLRSPVTLQHFNLRSAIGTDQIVSVFSGTDPAAGRVLEKTQR